MLRKEKRRLSLKEAVEVEACRAVKRLQITRDSPTILPQGTHVHSWTSTNKPVDAAHQLHLQSEAPVSRYAEPKSSSSVQSSLSISAKQTVPMSNGSPAAGLTRGTPQRSLSSPDMSRFKFRLTPNKPPVHPISSHTPMRQQSAVLAADLQASSDGGASFKKTSDRHSDQERLFHQLDRKLSLHAPQHQSLSPTQTHRSPPFPTAISMLSLSPKAGSPRATGDALATAQQREVTKADSGHGRQSKMPMMDRHRHAIEDDDSTCSESCQPSTPIRGEDSPPTREQDQALAENVFAAMYEQANVLLRNLHFERLTRRATSA